MHFKLDENVPLQLEACLLPFGSVSSVLSEKLSGIQDKALLLLCKRENFLLITLDSDFTNIQAYPPAKYQGIIVLRPGSQSISSVQAAFEQALRTIDIRACAGKLIIVESAYVRVRE